MSHWRIHSSLLLRPRNLIRVSAKNCGLLWGFCYPLSRLRHLVLLFSFSIPQKRNVNLLLLFCILTWSIEVGGKKEGNVLLICAAWGGVLMCSGSTWGLSINLLSTVSGGCHLPHKRRQRFGDM